MPEKARARRCCSASHRSGPILIPSSDPGPQVERSRGHGHAVGRGPTRHRTFRRRRRLRRPGARSGFPEHRGGERKLVLNPKAGCSIHGASWAPRAAGSCNSRRLDSVTARVSCTRWRAGPQPFGARSSGRSPSAWRAHRGLPRRPARSQCSRGPSGSRFESNAGPTGGVCCSPGWWIRRVSLALA